MTDRHPVAVVRLVAVALLVLGGGVVAADYASPAPTRTQALETGTGHVTVVTIDATGPSQLVAYGPRGGILYENHTFDVYHDVDPVPGERWTVTYAASDYGPAAMGCGADRCIRNAIQRLNLSTGRSERLHAAVRPANGSVQVHDVDRVNESTFLVGHIGYPDRVSMVNVTSGETIWEWRVSEAYEPSAGGAYPGDWTHLNDVEYLPDGRVMVSLRNMDSVVFVEPGEGLRENWTLGADDEHRILFEQHNPDYLPAERGGPAVVVADSENNRIVEYQRRNGSWKRSWVWTDAAMEWPRDADRLPGGNTLVADTHGNRLLEIAPDGDVVWHRSFPDGSYDVEYLGTGDESAGGESAASLGYDDAWSSDAGASGSDPVSRIATDLVPSRVLHGLLYALPDWVSPRAATVLLGQGALAVGWLLVEGVAYWRGAWRRPFG